MKNKNAIKNNMGQEVLKVVKVLHLSQSGTVSDMDSEIKIQNIHIHLKQQKHGKQIQACNISTF